MGHMIHPQAGRAIDQAAKRSAFLHWFGAVRPYDIDVLCELHNAMGSCLSADDLTVKLACTKQAIHVRICRLRTLMQTEAIDFVKGSGYRLTEIGLEETREAMRAMARSLVA